MILHRIAVKRLKALRRDKTIDFAPGLNIIKGGDNEAGKSSLRIAITKALFQDPTTSREDVYGLTSWGTDDPWEIYLEFQAGSESYRLTKSLRDGTCELARIGSSERSVTSKNAVADKIAEIVGCPSEVFFESTACIGQDELIGIIPQGATATERNKAFGTIAQRLQATISGAEAIDVPSILSKLYSKTHRKDARGPYWNLLRITERIQKLQAEKSAQQEKVSRVMENRRELNRIREELEKIGKDLPAKQEVVEKNNEILELQKEIERDKAQYNNYQRAKGLKSELDTLDGQLKRFSYFIGAEEKIEQVNTVRGELQGLEKQLAGLEEDIKTAQRQRPSLRFLFSGVGLMVGGLIGLFTSKYLGAVAATGFILLLYWLISHMAWKRQNKSISKKRTQLEGDTRRNNLIIKEVLSSFDCSDYAEYEKRLREYKEIIDKRKEGSNKLVGLVGEKDWATFEHENQDLDIRINAKQKELEQLRPFRLAPLELQELVSEVEEKGKRKKALEAKRSGLDEFFQYVDVDTDQLASISEELTQLEQEQDFWERKQKVFEKIREVLGEAHQHTLSRAANVLEGELGRHIGTVTGGRYTQVKIDEADLSLLTFSQEKGDWVNVLELSRATQDQFYICARFVLVKLITEGKQPPLLLDDPFVNFHPKRLNRMIQLLQELAKENQILLFTCSDAYDRYGNVILLE
jgi:uncharacterized protein YhaN